MEAKIKYLADCLDAVPILAQWLFNEWGYRSPDGTVQGMMDNPSRRLNRDGLPIALVAVEKGKPLGTASLGVKEVDIRPKYEHWLGTVYVHEPFRGKGIGSLLIEATAREVAKLGIEDLYLCTRRAETEGRGSCMLLILVDFIKGPAGGRDAYRSCTQW